MHRVVFNHIFISTPLNVRSSPTRRRVNLRVGDASHIIPMNNQPANA